MEQELDWKRPAKTPTVAADIDLTLGDAITDTVTDLGTGLYFAAARIAEVRARLVLQTWREQT